MQNICFLIGDINHSGGTERVTTLIANTLDEKQNNIFVLSLSNGDKPFFELNKDIHVDALFKGKVSMKKHFFQCVKRIRKFLIKNKIDTLIVVDSISCVFTVPACMGFKIHHICWEHFNFKVNLGSRFRNLGRWMAAKWCSRIVTLTKRDKGFWIEQYPNIKEKISVIANPSLFQNLDHQPSLENRTVLAVGRLDYIKGFDLLLKAWALVCEKIDEKWMLNIVGGGQEEANLKQLTQNLNIESRVIFSGQQKIVDPFYKNASIYCLSSRNEGFPMVLLEAQSYGLPIIAFDCDTGPAELIVDKKNGFLCKTEDVNDLADKVKSMILMDGDVYTNYSYESKVVVKKFSISNIILKWEKIL